jgi:arylsulfatase A-like enzyme
MRRLLRLEILVLAVVAACAPTEEVTPDPDLLVDLVREGRRDSKTVVSLDLGTPEAEASLGEGWSSPDMDRRRTIVWAVGSESTLEFDLAEPTPVVIQLHGKLHSKVGAAPVRVAVSLNGVERGHTWVPREWATLPYSLRLPAEATSAGRNLLKLAYGDLVLKAVRKAVRHRQWGVAWDRLDIVRTGRSLHSEDLDQIMIPAGESISIQMSTVGVSRLEMRELEFLGGARTLRVDRESPELEGVEPLHLSSGSELPLNLFSAGQSFLLRLGAEGPPGSSVRVTGPRVRGVGRTITRPNVLVYVVDTLRADHMGCYGYERPTSPQWDRLAAESILFEDAIAQASWTRPAVASILTGLAPGVHRVVHRDDALPESATTLAEALLGVGYATGAVITNGNVSSAYGFSQGFEFFSYMMESLRRKRVHRLAEEAHEEAENWLRSLPPDQPFFLYLHTSEPHEPYAPSNDPDTWSEISHRMDDRAVDLPEGAISELVALYYAEITQNDTAFGELRDSLEAAGVWDDTLVIFTSDHGEEFGDHGGFRHGKTVFDEQVKIPLIIKTPAPQEIRRVSEVVQQLDIYPTILDLLGLPTDSSLPGRSLLQGPADLDSRPAFSHLDLDGNRSESVIVGQWKLIRKWQEDRWRAQLFSRSKDPSESKDRIRDEPATAARLAELLQEESLQEGLESIQVEIDEELEARLKAVGYLD